MKNNQLREKEKDLVLNATSFQLVVSVDYSNNPIGVYLEVHQSKDPKNKKSVRIGTGVRNFILAEERFKFCGVAKKSLTKLMLLTILTLINLLYSKAWSNESPAIGFLFEDLND